MPIGIFDSGYGGLTIMREIVKKLPQYDYIYLGDNARAPYGTRSFETIYRYTLDAVKWFFDQNCHLVILACNTASAKALRSIQQNDLPKIDPNRRVLGVIRPTSEIIGNLSRNKHVGIFATPGTVSSKSYLIEIIKFFPELSVTQEACPMWVPLIENGEHHNEGSDYFVRKHIDNLLKKDPLIDTILLGCTHYPLMIKKIKKYLPNHIDIIVQSDIVANSLEDYLKRHPEIDEKCEKNSKRVFFTTDSTENFDHLAEEFYGKSVKSIFVSLP